MTAEGSAVRSKIVLASASSSRADLLNNARVPFEVKPAGVDEQEIKERFSAQGATAIDTADALAELKATTVSCAAPDHIVIGADQILDLDGQWFDKPKTMAEARSHLLSLRGRTHYLATAVVVAMDGHRVWETHDHPALTMRNFSDTFLDDYLASTGEAILSSVGAYHLEGLGAQLFDRIEGSFFSILGLPLLPLLTYLRERNALPL